MASVGNTKKVAFESSCRGSHSGQKSRQKKSQHFMKIQRLSEHKNKVISDNPIYEPFEVDLKNGDDFEILGKVLWIWIERMF